ncbi:hypothetical protein IMCC1989_1996 [gamma proteobacterium IMCC1989]|nr:hypothetical protein IMCC1989_1996 [gamma proteobacterium IMCC1989]
MSIDKLTSSTNPNILQTSNSLFINGKDDYASKLTIGQVIEARVMRHHEGNRYSVNLNGKEKVVDSANPLQPGELIEGRVKSLGQKIEIQRIRTAANSDNNALERKANQALLSGTPNETNNSDISFAKRLFAEKQVLLSRTELHLLKNLLSTNYSSTAVVLSALAIKKTGLELTRESIIAVTKALTDTSLQGAKNAILDIAVLEIESNIQVTSIPQGIIKELAENIKSYAFLNDNSELAASTDIDGNNSSDMNNAQDNGEKNLAHWILNIQDEGSINHRLMTFPIWLGDKLIEIRMAFFDQERSKESSFNTQPPFKKMVFSVDLEELGTVTASAITYGSHMTLSLTGDNTKSTSYMANYIDTLKTLISSMGWNVDSLEYATMNNTEFDSATHSVIEHYINKDSVSRLV